MFHLSQKKKKEKVLKLFPKQQSSLISPPYGVHLVCRTLIKIGLSNYLTDIFTAVKFQNKSLNTE